MPFDGFTLGLVARELDDALTGGRVNKIIQPERDEIILTIRSGGENRQLLLSATANCARAHLTTTRKNNPLEPPALCMLMRKHITGGRVCGVRALECDRILEIEIEHFDELGDRARKRIICEFMGKHSNLNFVGGDGRIIDSARRVNEQISSVREVLPGLRYELPPAHGKLPYDAVTAESLYAAMAGMNGPLHKLIAQCVSGMSAQTAREASSQACVSMLRNRMAFLRSASSTPGCTRSSTVSPCRAIPRIRSIRDRFRIWPPNGTAAPVTPVRPPCTVTGIRSACSCRTSAQTSASERGKEILSACPVTRDSSRQ